MYVRSPHLPSFGGKPGKPSNVITSSCGTRQGCPLGAQLFALWLQPFLCSLARLVGENGSVIAYAECRMDSGSVASKEDRRPALNSVG